MFIGDLKPLSNKMIGTNSRVRTSPKKLDFWYRKNRGWSIQRGDQRPDASDIAVQLRPTGRHWGLRDVPEVCLCQRETLRPKLALQRVQVLLIRCSTRQPAASPSLFENPLPVGGRLNKWMGLSIILCIISGKSRTLSDLYYALAQYTKDPGGSLERQVRSHLRN